MIYKVKDKKGITLIALVVTIIVLIILAGVSINLVLGENGILTKARDAKEIQTKAEILQELEMQKMEVAIDGNGYTGLEEYVEHLKNTESMKLGKYVITGMSEIKEDEDTGKYVEITVDDKYTYIATQVGNDVIINGKGDLGESGENQEITIEADFTFTHSTEEWTRNNVTVTVSTSVTGYTLQTSIDGINWSDVDSQEFSENGSIYARVTDGTNTSEIATDNVTNIDKEPPVIVSISSTKDTIKAYATDELSGIKQLAVYEDAPGGWANKNLGCVKEYNYEEKGFEPGTRYITDFTDAVGNSSRMYIITKDDNIETLNLSDWQYEITEITKYVKLTKYIGTNTDLMLRKMYKIGDEIYTATYTETAFKGNTIIKSVTFEDGAKINTYDSMFSGCTALEEVNNLPQSYSPYMNYTFQNCTSLRAMPKIPENLLGMTATFNGCSSLTFAIVPESVTNIVGAFNGCYNMKALVLKSSNITSAGGFYSAGHYTTYQKELLIYVPSLTSTTYNNIVNIVPTNSDYEQIKTINSLDEWGYELDDTNGIIKLLGFRQNRPDVFIPNTYTVDGKSYKVRIPNYERFYSYKEIMIFDDEVMFFTDSIDKAFSSSTTLKAVLNIPDHVTSMANTFSGCTVLTTVSNIPKNVTNMDNAFASASVITTIPRIPESVTSMNYTFAACNGLTTAPIIPKNVTSMNYTFVSCTNLTKAPIIPEKVTSMNSTFASCSNLSGEIIIEATEVTNATSIVAATYGYSHNSETNKWVTIKTMGTDTTTYKTISEQCSTEINRYFYLK